MTGYGGGSATLEGGKVSVEVRSVNHKFVDIRTRVPSEWLELTGRIEQIARKSLPRGRHEVSVQVRLDSGAATFLDHDRIAHLHRDMKRLGEELGIDAQVSWDALLRAPGVFSSSKERVDLDTVARAATKAFNEAVEDSRLMRTQEGNAIERDLRARMLRMRQMLSKLRETANSNVAERREKLRLRLDALLEDTEKGSVKVDEVRLEQEIALLADKLDVSEELTRLSSHFDQWDKLSVSEQPIGRKLDFLVQEVLRELNTIGSKCQNAAMVHVVVEMKAEQERIREQVQNVE